MGSKMSKEYFQDYYLKNKTHKRIVMRKYYKNKQKKIRTWSKNHYKENSILYRNRMLKRNYNIDVTEYNRIFIEQNGRCAICGKHQSQLKARLHVDHNHKTKIIRGLLCGSCNVGIGMFHDNPEDLNIARQYLLRYL